jgi:hypothetical protein
VITSKSPRRVLQVAYEAACRALPAHAHKFSPKKFTQPQLLACLVLKEFSRLDYRGLAEHLSDHPDLGRQIGLKAVPHFTTFQKAAQRLLAAVPGRRMFEAVLERAVKDRVRRRRVRLAAIDGTGMESRHVSRYYTKRQADGNPDGGRTYAHYPKAVFVVDCDSHMILAAVPGRGPATDLGQFGRAFSQAVRRARIEVLLADADIRRRVAASGGPLARHPDDHPTGAGPAVGGAAGGAMAAGDEAAVRATEAQVWSEVAGGDRELDDQAAAQLGPPRAGRGEPVP